MRKRVKVSIKAVLQLIQLAAIAISTAFQKDRARRPGMSAFIRAATISNGTCTIVFTARSSVPKANRAAVQIDRIDSPIQELSGTLSQNEPGPVRDFASRACAIRHLLSREASTPSQDACRRHR